MPIYKKVNKNFFKKWSYDMAYVLGFFAADGYITHNKRGSSFWSIDIIDKELLISIKKIIDSDHKITERIRKNNDSNIYRLQIGSKEMVEDLSLLGFNAKKSSNLTVPNIPKKYISDFIRGYFDGDGNVWVGRVHKERKTSTVIIQVAFTSVSKNFLNSIRILLYTQGLVGGSIYTHKTRNFSRLAFVNKNALKIYKIMYNRKTPLFLNRKKEVFERYMRL
ncbi:MAG: hypothetical protein NTW35_01035 [Candidatus Nomurabacteria bacterium]|nr:hypothetical protein [Candidatus Nomurabacteria bacterium]